MPSKLDALKSAIGRQGVALYLEQFEARGSNLIPLWEWCIGIFHDMEKQVLDAEGRAPGYHDRWPELRPRYKAWKDRHFPGRSILELTGTMYKHLTQNPAPNCYYIKDATTLTILPGLDLPNHPGDLIAVHQMGRSGRGERTTTWSTQEIGDWEEGVSTTGTRSARVTSAMEAREPVRLTRRGVHRMGTAVISYLTTGKERP